MVERVESAHFLKMLSDETCCGWRVGTNCKFFYRRICLACVLAHQLDQRLYSSGDCGRAGLCSIITWYSLIGQAPAYLTDLYRPSLSVRSTRHLRSAEQGLLHVPFARTFTMQSRAFSVVGPLVWNGLPLALRSLSRVFSQKFLQQLKTTLFGALGLGAASE